MTIRKAGPNDSNAVLTLAQDFATSFAVDEPAFYSSFAELSTRADTHLAIAEVQGVVVGYVLAFSHTTFYANGPVVWVEEITVAPECRRQGIGQALMQGVEGWAALRGCALVALATRRASDFYEAIGYEASATYFRKLL